MSKKKQFRFRVGQEVRANLPDENGRSWGRPRRAHAVKSMFTDWDSRDRHYQRDKKSWKRKRDKQYYVDGRQRKHSVTLPGDQLRTWLLSQYFEKHGIPFRILPRREKRTSVYWVTTERRACYNVPNYPWHCYIRPAHCGIADTRQRGWKTVYYDYPLETPIRKERSYWVTVEYTVTWWSNKDINIEKILAAYP